MKIRVLAWIERGLFAAGAGLAVWCAIVVLQAEYYKRLPVPSPTAGSVAALPGETPHANLAAARRPTVKAGSWVARLEAPGASKTPRSPAISGMSVLPVIAIRFSDPFASSGLAIRWY